MIKQVIVVNTALKMRRGKESAQCAHAAMEFLRQATLTNTALLPNELEWLRGLHAKVVVGVGSEAELLAVADQAIAAGLTVHRVVDSGFTEFHGVPTLTCIAIGPDLDTAIDPVTRHLTLR